MKPSPTETLPTTHHGRSGLVRVRSVRKRDGSETPFDPKKIESAILRAGLATGEYGQTEACELTRAALLMLTNLSREAVPEVERIQDLVETVLMGSPYKKTAKAYILYRGQHARIREIAARANVDLVNAYLERRDWRVQENSNTGYALQGLNNYAAGAIASTYWLEEVYPPEVGEAHKTGDLHIHDLGFLAPYCVGWVLRDLLLHGIQGAPGKVASGPARHFSSALSQMVNFIFSLQGEAAGAQAFSNVDTLLAPFIREDGLGYREVKQAIQESVFCLNMPGRAGFQAPFTNFSMDLRVPTSIAGEKVMIGGEVRSETYGEYQTELDMFNRALLEVMAAGDAAGRPLSFPIITYSVTPDFPWDDPTVELMCEVTGKCGIPYFANYIGSGRDPADVRSMCCHLHLDLSSLENRGGGLFGAAPLTGSIGVVTLNMPRIGYQASSEREFLDRLDGLLDIAHTSLEVKRKTLERFTDKGLYPYSRFYLRQVKECRGCNWANHFSTIGLVGQNEACINLLGRNIGTTEGLNFSARTLDHIRGRLSEFQRETGHLYNLEATPAESAGYRMARLDKKRYPDIKCGNEVDIASGAQPFYTNASQLPVNYTDDVFLVLDLQDPLQVKYSGGTVIHAYLGESEADPRAVKRFVRTVCENYRLPYFTITPTFSVCPSHGYIRGEEAACPQCGSETEVYSRVVGYLRPVKQWNEGKQAEFAMRSKFRIGERP